MFSLYNERGVEKNYKGAWILVDGRYPSWTSLTCPFKASSSESMRKDVECTFGIMKGKNSISLYCILYTFHILHNLYSSLGRWKILKTGVRMNGLEVVDDIWFTCCAFHNMLLHCDGLDRRWNKGVISPFQGELGWHAPGVIQSYCDPIIIRRFRSGRQGNNPCAFDCSILESDEINRINKDVGVDDNDVINEVQEARSLQTLSNFKFCNILVTHFNRLWELGKLIWPSRTGKMALG